MDCPLKAGKGTEVFVAYSAKTLPVGAERAFQQHLESCADCRRLAHAQNEVWSALDAWTPARVSSDFDAQLYARIAAEEAQPRWRRLLWSLSGADIRLNWSWKPAMPVAAACAVLLAAFLLKNPVPEHRPQASVEPQVDIEQVERALDDIDMFKQLGLSAAFPPAGKPAHSISM